MQSQGPKLGAILFCHAAAFLPLNQAGSHKRDPWPKK
jgi:hypothetical protein